VTQFQAIDTLTNLPDITVFSLRMSMENKFELFTMF
jgi:hypothetical protein